MSVLAKKIIKPFITFLVLVMVLTSCSAGGIKKGVKVGSVDLSGMTKEEAVKALSQKYKIDDINATVDCDGTVFDVYGSAFSLKIDYDATAEAAVSYGSDESAFSLKKDSSKKELGLVISCDYDALQYAINENLGAMLEDVQQHSVEFGENEIIVSNGKAGKTVPAQKILDGISDAIINDTLSEPIKVSVEVCKPEPIDPDEFYKEYNRDFRDASVKEDGDEITIIPEVVGVKLLPDKDEVARILKDNAKNSGTYTIPAEITYPTVTAAQLESEYTDTVIATYSTDYSTSSANRKTNIHLASDQITGLVLNPGEVFSYNDVVGPRTAANGYKVAHVYSGSKVVDGLGGGICQVSSTLYNAVVFADLEIVYRKNHSLPVSYTPLGRDATVSYGSIDFKFKNNKETPIKLEFVYDGSTLTANIYGRKKYIKDISIETAITGSVPFSVTEIEDDTMFVGETKVEEAGSNGTVVEAYKIVKENGQVVSRTLLAKSTYTPQTKVVRVGTKPKEEVIEPEPVIPETPEAPTQPETEPEVPVTETGTPDVPATTVPEVITPVETPVSSAGQVY